MIDISKHIEEKEKRFHVSAYFKELQDELTKKGVPQPDASQFAYAAMVLTVGGELHKRPWLGEAFTTLSLKPFDDTIKEMRKEYGDLLDGKA